MISSRRFATLAVGVLTVATLTGIASAGTASALTATSGPYLLCVDYSGGVCAYGSSPIGELPYGTPTETEWLLVPNGSTYFYIKQDGTTKCMELSHVDDNSAVEAPCEDETPFLWRMSGEYILNEWATSEDHTDECLTFNAAGSSYSDYHPDFDVISCRGDTAEFFSYITP